jgi:hypothetical protein
VLSSLLTACYETIVPTLGSVTAAQALENYHTLCSLGFEAADLLVADYSISHDLIRRFRGKFGSTSDGTGAVLSHDPRCLA